MPTTERITVTVPADTIARIDRFERNRSRFVQKALAHELERRERELFELSLNNPHSEGHELESAGLDEWIAAGEKDQDLLNPEKGQAVKWVEGVGFVTN